MLDKTINVDRMEHVISVFGSFDENLRIIESELGVHVTDRDSELKISGEPEQVIYAERAIEALLSLAAKGENIDSQIVHYIIKMVLDGKSDKISELARDVVCVTAKGKPIKAKTLGQKKYVEAIAKNTITIGVGPAGTGKTYLAVAAAVAAFREKRVNRIVLTRPAVEAVKSSAFCRETCSTRLTPICALCTMLFSICSVRRHTQNISSAEISRLRLWHTCGAGRLTIRL